MGAWIKPIISTVLILGLLTNCSRPNYAERSHPAPLNDQQAGLIVMNISEDQLDKLMTDHPLAKVRIINPKHQLNEIFGIDKQTILSYAPTALVEPNKVMQIHNKKKTAENFTPLPEIPENHPLTQCVINASQTNLEIAYKKTPQKNIEVGEHIVVTAVSGDVQVKLNPGEQIFWQTVAPKGSYIDKELIEGVDNRIIPDMAGLYYIHLFSKNKNRDCSLVSVPIMVTHNPEFVLQAPLLPVVDFTQFTQIADVQAEQAWQFSTGENVVIAVIDSGVDYNNPSLNQNIQTSSTEIPANGIDDDNNGFIDDYVGYDMVQLDAFPYDDEGHGTHVAALAASPIFGIAPNAKILPIKAMSAYGTGDIASLSGAILYAVDQKADIINLSLASYKGSNKALLKALSYAKSNDVLIVSAVGNGDASGIAMNLHNKPSYPAVFPYNNIVTVGSHGLGELITSYTNYGKEYLDILAPGGNSEQPLFSAYVTNPRGIYLKGLYGTSMATPVVAGIAALVKNTNSDLSAENLRDILMQAGTDVPQISDYVGSAKHISALQAVQLARPLNVSAF